MIWHLLFFSHFPKCILDAKIFDQKFDFETIQFETLMFYQKQPKCLRSNIRKNVEINVVGNETSSIFYVNMCILIKL